MSAGVGSSAPTRDGAGFAGAIPGAGMAGRRRRRVLRPLTWDAAVLLLLGFAAGTTWALFDSTIAVSGNDFTAGTVSLGASAPSGTCSASAALPDGSTRTCTLKVTYSGSRQAWMGLDVFIATKPASRTGAENLYNPGAADHPATFTVTDGQSAPVTYTLPTTALGSCPTASSSIDGTDYSSYNQCYLGSNLLVSTSTFASGASVTFSIAITIPTNNGTNYQGGTAVAVIRPRAVQSTNNGSTTTCTPGSACPGVTSWS